MSELTRCFCFSEPKNEFMVVIIQKKIIRVEIEKNTD